MVHMFQVRVEDKQRGVAVLVLALMLFKNVLHHGQHLWHPVIVCVLPHREGEEWGREPPVTTAQTSLKQESSVIYWTPPPTHPPGTPPKSRVLSAAWVNSWTPTLGRYAVFRILSTISWPSGWTAATWDHILSQVMLSMGKPPRLT